MVFYMQEKTENRTQHFETSEILGKKIYIFFYFFVFGIEICLDECYNKFKTRRDVMLEYDFNELDNDFITLWSKYIMTGGDMRLCKDIEQLAELGQINAIQSWYLIKGKDVQNETIDNYVNEFEKHNGPSANELLAIAHRYYSQENERAYKYFSDRATGIMGGQFESNSNPLYGQRYYELYIPALEIDYNEAYNNAKHSGRTVNDPWDGPIPESLAISKEFDRKITSCARVLKGIRKALISTYKDGNTSPQVTYALGKNIVLFKDYLQTSTKTNARGLELLTDLSKRPLSFKQSKVTQEENSL